MNTVGIVLLVLLAFLVLLWFTRLGGRVEYSEAGLTAALRVGPLYVKVYPRKKKKPAKKKPEAEENKKKQSGKKFGKKKKHPTEKQAAESQKSGGRLDTVMNLLPDVFQLAGEAVRKLRVEDLVLEYTIAGRHDAAGAAVQYGTVYATGGALYGLLEQHLDLKNCRIGAEVDFNEETPKVYACLNLSYRTGQLVVIGIHALKVYLKLNHSK